MTTWVATARGRLEALETRANQLITTFSVIRALLIVLSVPFFLTGWTVRLVFRLGVVVVAWLWAALETGWQAGRKRDRHPGSG